MKRLIFAITLLTSILLIAQIATGDQDENIFKVGIGAFKDELYMISEAQFRIIVEQYPNSRYFNEAIYYLTLSQYRNKKYDDALKTISLIKSKYSYIKYYPNVLFLEGKIYYEVGQYKQAIKSFENYLRLFPINEDAPFAQYLMASSYTSLSNYDRAIELLKEIERRYPNSPIVEESKFKLAETYRLSGDLQNALNEFQNFITKFTNSKYLPDAHYNLGLITFNLSKSTDTNYLQQSASYFQKASEYNSSIKPFALFNAGISYLATGKTEEAKSMFSNLISEFSSYTQPEIKSTVIEGYLNLARIQKELGDTNSAVSNYMNVITYGGENAIKASIELSSLLNSLNRSEEAIKVLEPFTNDTKVLFNYAISLKNKDPNTAESILVSIISNNDKSEIVDNYTVDNSIVELLKLLISKGNYEKVISYTKLLSDKASSDYAKDFIYLMLGEANLNLKDYKSAISAYSMVKNESLKEDAIEGIAYTHYLSENYALAIKFYSELANNYKQGKYTERAYYMLGLCYEKIKDTDKAISSHQQNLIYGKDTKYILSSAISLGWIYLKIGKFDDAIGIASKYIDTAKDNPTIQIQLLEILAWSYDGKKDYKKAVDTFLQIIKSENLNDFQRIRYYNYISLMHEKAGQYQDAINTITKNIIPIALSNNYSNDYVESLGRLTLLYIRQNDINKARQTISSLIPYTNVQKTYEYIYRFGEYLYSINQFDEAAQMFMTTAKGSSDTDLRDEAYYWGGWAFFNTQKVEDAVNVFNEFVKISSSSKVPSVLITLGDIMVNRGDYEKAKYYYNIVVNNYKDKPEYNTAVLKLSKLASASSKTTETPKKVEEKKPEEKPKNIESLISSLEEVSKSKDKESASKAKFELAMIYKSQGNYQKAIDLLQGITEEVYNETAAQAQFEIGEILRSIGDYNKAWKEYIKVVYIYKDYKDIVVKAMYYTIYCYVQLKDYENAKKLYEKMERDFYKNPWTEKAKELIK